MIYTFTESDIATLGITDDTIKALLLKTSIVDSSYDEGLVVYVAPRKPQFNYLGGIDMRTGTSGSTIISLMQENNRTKLTLSSTTEVKIGSEDLTSKETYDIHYTIGTIDTDGGSNSKAGSYTKAITDITHLNIKGKSNIFGIIYDGDKTLTYGDKSITIEVYDENGLTVKGQKGVKGIVYNGTRVKELILNGTSHIMKDKIICSNGIELPVPHEQNSFYGDGINHWVIRDDTTTGYYDLYYASNGFGYYNNAIYQKDSSKKLSSTYSTQWYRISKTAPTNYWIYNKSATGGFALDATKPLIASSDNILSYSSMDKATTDVYFAKTHDN